MNANQIIYVINKTLAMMYLSMLITFMLLTFYMGIAFDHWQVLIKYYWSYLYTSLFNTGLLMDNYEVRIAIRTENLIFDSFFYAFIVGVVLLPLLAYLIWPKKKKKYIRGAKFTPRYKLKFNKGLPCGKVRIPEGQEYRHFFIVGKPGTGKTVFMLQLLHSLIKNNAKSIIYDFKGDYISQFYNESTDMIFNPIDERSVYWNFFDDIETELDIETVTATLIPQNKKEIWNDAARDVLTGIIYYLWEQNQRTIADLWRCLIASNAEIANIMQQTERGKRGYKYIQEVDSKQTVGVIATLTQFTKCFEIIRKPRGKAFTLKNWLTTGKGNLYVSNYSNSQAILKPVLTLFIDMLSKKLLDVKASKQKTCILIDELGTLNRLDGVKRLLTLGRSYHCACFLGIQDVAQIDHVYGSDNRKTMLNSCGNWLIFGVSDFDTAQICSNRIGDTEYYEIERSWQIGKQGGSEAKRKKREPLVLPSELQSMRDLFFYFLIGNQIVRNRLTIKDYEVRTEPLMLRADLIMNHEVEIDENKVKVIEKPAVKAESQETTEACQGESDEPDTSETDETISQSDDSHAENNIATPEIPTHETQTQLNLFNENHINRFIAEKTEPDAGGRIKKSVLFDIYKGWCGIDNIKPLTKGKFYKAVDSMVAHKTKGTAYYINIKLKCLNQ